MNYKLIAMDLDGTLNNDEKRITEKTLCALMAAQKQGIRLALASARPSPGLYKESNILHLPEYGGILMSYNGGRIVDAGNGKSDVRNHHGSGTDPQRPPFSGNASCNAYLRRWQAILCD